MTTEQSTEVQVQATPTGALIRALSLISAICGLIIVASYEGTLSAAQANRRLATERAVFKVLPDAKAIEEFLVVPGKGIQPVKGAAEPPAGSTKFYSAYDANGKLIGVATEAAAKGYADVVRIMFGYKPECQCVVGISVVSMKETPGIGDKIITDKDFLVNFKALDVKLNADMSALINEVNTVKHGSKTNPWQIDAIAGATITSRAVGKGINEAAGHLLPKLVPNLDKIRSKS